MSPRSRNATRYTPIRVAAEIARRKLLEAAEIVLGDAVTNLTAKAGAVTSLAGGTVSFGEFAERAASTRTKRVSAVLKPSSEFTVIGTPRNRSDARDAVTGRKKFSMDLDVPATKPTMVCRPPTTKGTVDGESDDTVLEKVRAAEIPLTVPDLGPLTKTAEQEFTFRFRSNSASEPNTAVVDVRPDGAEVWSAPQSPILAQEAVAKQLGLPVSAVTVLRDSARSSVPWRGSCRRWGSATSSRSPNRSSS